MQKENLHCVTSDLPCSPGTIRQDPVRYSVVLLKLSGGCVWTINVSFYWPRKRVANYTMHNKVSVVNLRGIIVRWSNG